MDILITNVLFQIFDTYAFLLSSLPQVCQIHHPEFDRGLCETTFHFHALYDMSETDANAYSTAADVMTLLLGTGNTSQLIF